MENWPILITFNYPPEAHMVKGYLASNGIETILKDELTTQVISYLPSAIGGVKLLIRDSEYEQGIQLLKNGGYLNGEDSQSESKVEIVWADKTTDKKICPFCQSDNIAIHKKSGAVTAVVFAILNLIVMFGAFAPRFRSSFTCFDCGKEWKFRKREA